MIYDDQPQMVDALTLEVDGGPLVHSHFRLERVFAAIDREALIETLARAYYEGVREDWGMLWEHASPPLRVLHLKGAERGLIDAGVIPERA